MGKYKVGQLSKAMGVSTHLLKHYEKFGLIQPQKDDSTNYRYYDISQCSRIIESKKFKNMGFSLSEIKELTTQDSNDAIEAKVNKNIAALDEQIEMLQKQKAMSMLYLKDSEEMNERLGQWFITMCPVYQIFLQTKGHDLIEDHAAQDELSLFLHHIPDCKSVLYIEASTYETRVPVYHWGLIRSVEQQEKRIQESNHVKNFERGRYFVTYLSVETPYTDNNRLIERILMEYHQFQSGNPTDTIAIRYQITHDGEKETHYFRILIPII